MFLLIAEGLQIFEHIYLHLLLIYFPFSLTVNLSGFGSSSLVA